MTSPTRTALAAAGLALASMAAPVATTPAMAAINNQEPGAFITTLTSDGFAALRTGNRAAAKARFRTLVGQHVAVDSIGDRLIRRFRAQITPAQYQAYRQVFPNFIVGTYADNLFNYANATVRVNGTRAAGNGAAVSTTVTKPGQAPIAAVWTVVNTPGGYKISNLTVGGVNLALAQEQDFTAYIQRNGFDRFLAFIRQRAQS